MTGCNLTSTPICSYRPPKVEPRPRKRKIDFNPLANCTDHPRPKCTCRCIHLEHSDLHSQLHAHPRKNHVVDHTPPSEWTLSLPTPDNASLSPSIYPVPITTHNDSFRFPGTSIGKSILHRSRRRCNHKQSYRTMMASNTILHFF